MDIHDNARLTPRSRAELVRRVVVLGQRRADVARSFGVALKTVTKWVRRFEREGAPGLRNRSSRPHRLFRPTPETIVEQIMTLRLQRCTGRQIASETGVSPATISRVLKRR